MNHIFFSLISLFVALFFTLLGIVAVIIPWSPAMRGELIRFILDESVAISLFGIAFLAIGLSALVNIYLNSKRCYYYVKSKDASVVVDEGLLYQYLNIYWKQMFPKTEIPCQVFVRNNKIHISVDLPYLPTAEQKPLLERIKQDLESSFKKNLGYQDEFYLTATFPSEKLQ